MHQDVHRGKVDRKCWSNAVSVICVIREAALAMLLSFPEMFQVEEYTWKWLEIREILRRRDPKAEAVLAPTLLLQPTIEVFSTLVRMWVTGAMRMNNSASFARWLQSSRLFMEMSSFGLEKETRRSCVVWGDLDLQTYYCPSGLRQTSPMPMPEAYMVPK